MRLLASLFLLASYLIATEKKVVVPANAPAPVGPYSPGISAGDYLYVSGQGARNAQNQFAATFAEQAEQCMRNVQAIVEAGGMKMSDIVYAQIYLADMKNYDAVNTVWTRWFPSNQPARAVLGVTRMPTETPIEITIVAARSSVARKAIGGEGTPQAIVSGDRIYLSGVLGRNADSRRIPSDPKAQVKLAVEHVKSVLKQARKGLGDAAFLNVYVTEAIDPALVEKELASPLGKAPRGILRVASLPLNANIEITGVFAPKGSDLHPVSAISGDTADILNKIQAELKARGLTMADVVASNVYIDDLNNFAAMNNATFFSAAPPTRTTVQLTPPAAGKQNIISVIAVK